MGAGSYFFDSTRRNTMAYTTTPSGLQYEDAVVGEGAEATKG